jgi:CRISPR-associated protein Cas1
MQVVYLCEPYCTLHRNLDHLVVRKGGAKLETIPLVNTGCLVVFGATQVTTQALSLLFDRGIDVVFMTLSGRIRGRILSESANNVLLRIAQHERYRDPIFRLETAKRFVASKVLNQAELLRLCASNGVFGASEARASILDLLHRIDLAEDVSELMGIEGICARYYFGVFPAILEGHMTFAVRQGRPAKDPVNALLNLCYAFLRNEFAIRLGSRSFDVDLGFLHGIRYGRQSLPLDMMEEFRPLFADRFVLSLFNRSQIRPSDFEPGENGLLLKRDVMKKFVGLYQENLRKTTGGSGQTWNGRFDHCVEDFRKWMLEGNIVANPEEEVHWVEPEPDIEVEGDELPSESEIEEEESEDRP